MRRVSGERKNGREYLVEKKRRSIVQRVSWILIWTSVLSFVGGCFALSRLEASNTEYIYQLTEELLGGSVRELEERLEDIQGTLYGLVVSDEIQEAGSLLIGDGEESPSALEQASGLNVIVDSIQNGIRSDQAIVCANFLYGEGLVRVAASTSYCRLSEEAADAVEEQALAASGQNVFLDGETLMGEENLLIIAKQLRERKNLSLAHIGVIVLFVDVEELGRALTDAHDGIFVLQGQDGMLEYVLNDTEGLMEEQDLTRLWEREAGYSIEYLGGRSWFMVSFGASGEFFSYTLLEPYTELFADVRQAFAIYAGIFALCSVAAMLIAFLSTHRVTRDIKLFIQHISKISGGDTAQLPMYERQDIHDKDVYALKGAFNKMSARINELVRDNYMKQLLVKETQLRALQSQMNPHFLYNTLNSLYWMAKTAEMPAAADMISSLGILLREAISDEEFVITIDRELDIACHYFIIQKHRYEDRLEAKFDVSEECSSLVIPKFTLQPLAENAIAYGLECMLGTCTVEIRIFLEREACICQVRNTGPGPEEGLLDKLKAGIVKPKGNGIGLMNIQQRIQSVFGEAYGVDIFREGEETVAQIRMSCISLEEYRSSAAAGGKPNGKRIQNDGGG